MLILQRYELIIVKNTIPIFFCLILKRIINKNSLKLIDFNVFRFEKIQFFITMIDKCVPEKENELF